MRPNVTIPLSDAIVRFCPNPTLEGGARRLFAPFNRQQKFSSTRAKRFRSAGSEVSVLCLPAASD